MIFYFKNFLICVSSRGIFNIRYSCGTPKIGKSGYQTDHHILKNTTFEKIPQEYLEYFNYGEKYYNFSKFKEYKKLVMNL